jgi:hypothetical protein
VDAKNVSHGFVRSASGKLIEFDSPGAGTVPDLFQGTFPISINPSGQIAGNYVDANTVGYGFLRSPGGTFTTFAVPGQGTTAGQNVMVFQ